VVSDRQMKSDLTNIREKGLVIHEYCDVLCLREGTGNS
jgi:hypothetical protein